jgi:hypothetical protein
MKNDDMISPDQPEWEGIARADREMLARAEEAIAVHRRGLDRIFLIGEAFAFLQKEAMDRSNSQNPIGRRYNEAFGMLEKPMPGATKINKTDRNQYIFCWQYREAIRAWWQKQDQRQRDRWNHPDAVKRHFQASLGIPRARPAGRKGVLAALDAAAERIENAADSVERTSGGAAALVLELTPEGMPASIESFVDVYGREPVFSFVEGLLPYLDKLDKHRTVELVRQFLQSSAPHPRRSGAIRYQGTLEGKA